MRLTIGKKLGFGFGAIILLIAICAGVAFVQLTTMDARLNEAFEHAFPASRASERALTGLARVRSAVRGYLLVRILGNNPEEEKVLLQQRAEAWQSVDAAIGELTNLSASWSDGQARQDLERVKTTIEETRAIQRQISEMIDRADNLPANQTMSQEAEPRVSEILASLSTMMQEEQTAEATSERKKLLAAVSETFNSFALSLGSLKAFLASADESMKVGFEKYAGENDRADLAVTAMERLFSKSQQLQWDRYTRLRAELKPVTEKIFAQRQAKDWNRAIYTWESEHKPRADELRRLLAEIAFAADNNLQKAREEVNSASDVVDVSLIVATMAAIFAGCTIAFLLSRSISTAVGTLADRVRQISTGDLTGQALLLKSTDELGELAGGFNSMLGGLKDLTKQILTVTENVNSATTQIASSTKQQASSTKEQAATVQQITTTMKELSQSGSQIVDKAKEVAAAAESVADSSRSGIDAVLGTTRTMDAIREQVEEVAQNIVALSEKTQAVGEIIATVNDIAEQSNLLALNASIEAADAGDDGNRFSVVASEMKNLADQAKGCTVQVRGILGDIQKGINTAVMLAEEAVKRVDTGKQQADISERTIREMVITTQSSVDAYQQIIGATNQQQIGYEQVAKGMQDIDQAARQTASTTAQLEQALGSLSAMSHQLKSAVMAYRV